MTSIQHNDPDESINPLAEDNDPPFSPPNVPAGDPENNHGEQLDPTHPNTDGGLDSDEEYNEGIVAAAEASEPDTGIPNYNPENDQRKNDSSDDQTPTPA